MVSLDALHLILLVQGFQGLLQAVVLGQPLGVAEGLLPVANLQHVDQTGGFAQPPSELWLSLREGSDN